MRAAHVAVLVLAFLAVYMSSHSSAFAGAVLQGSQPVNAAEILSGSQLRNENLWSIKSSATLDRRELAEGVSDCDYYGDTYDCADTCAQYDEKTKRDCPRDDCCKCSWLGDECKSADDVTCPEFTKLRLCNNFDGCSWVGKKNGECKDTDDVECPDLVTKVSCTKLNGCSWVGRQYGGCKSSDDVTCSDVVNKKICQRHDTCSWVGTSKDSGECKGNDEISCSDFSKRIPCRAYDGCTWVGRKRGDCRDEDSVSCIDFAGKRQCRRRDGCKWRKGKQECVEE